MQSLRQIEFDIHYEGTASYLTSFLIPALEKSIIYKRATGYFNVESLIAVSRGLESLIMRGGRMQLLLGLHDLTPELVLAQSGSKQVIEPEEETSSRLQDLIREIGSLQDALKLRRLETLTRLISGRHLEVKLAKPVGVRSSHIFHVKRFILEDGQGDFVCATGSPNETLAGAEGNFEEISTFRSWQDQSGHVEELRRKFDSLWNGEAANLAVFDLADAQLFSISSAIRNQLENLGIDTSVELASRKKFVSAIKDYVPAKLFTFDGARLYPHQEYAYLKALSRWPVRVLLADEVGLGKTLEVGSVIRYLKDVAKIPSGLILAPKNVVLQLQAELSEKFDLHFMVWNSTKQRYVNSDGKAEIANFGPPGSPTAPDWIIVSSQWARGSSSRSDIFEEMEKPPALLIVDEAHAARVPAPESKSAPSRLFSALERASQLIPHLILMTATPMQLHVSEYHGLLRLLGLPNSWSRLRNFELALRLQADPDGHMSLNDGKILASMAKDAACLVQSPIQRNPGTFQSLKSKNPVEAAVQIKREWPDSVQDFIRVNPASQLTVRNTRSSLERFGYKFPERRFMAPNIAMPTSIPAIKLALDSYLSTTYGKVEELISIDGKGISRGFVSSIYEQRFASSLWALRSSLTRRKEKLEALYFNRGDDIEFDDDDLMDVESEVVDWSRVENLKITDSLRSAIQNEVNYLEDIKNLLDAVDSGPIEGDQKLVAAKDVILSKASSSEKTIVFSRYTDTLNALVQTISNDRRFEGIPFGFYTGQDCWISDTSGKSNLSKSQLQTALARGRIEFVICSDAASEGINLQSASVLVNVDVPWNPGRLEQRIGRIARLGQKAQSVDVVNLWFPHSVEATMYGRLLERKELYDLAVGAFPDLFARGIRESVSLHSGNRLSYSGDVLEKLEGLREEAHLKGLAMLWGDKTQQKSKSRTLWENFDSTFDSIGLQSSPQQGMNFDGLLDITSNFGSATANSTLFAYANDYGVWNLELRLDEAGTVIRLSASDLPNLISITFSEDFRLLHGVGSDREEWLPNHANFLSVNPGALVAGECPQPEELNIIEVGRLEVRL